MIKPSSKLLAVFGLILAACIVAALFRQQLLEPVAKRLVIQAVDTGLGLEITVDKISGSFFGDLRFSGIRTVKPAESGLLVSIGADSLEAFYSLPQLLHGVDAFLGSLKLELDGARVAMDFSRTGDGTSGENASSGAPLVLPVSRARNADIDLRGRGWSLYLSGTDLTVEPFDERLGGIPLTAHAAASVIELPRLHPQTPELGVRGVLSRDFVEIADLAVNGRKAVEKARFDYAPGQPVSSTVSFNGFGGSGKIEAVFAKAATELGWDLQNIDLSAITALLSPAVPPVSGQLSSNGRLTGNFAEPASLRGTYSLVATDGSIRDKPFSRLALKGAAENNVLRLDSLEAVLGENSLSASGVSAPLAPLLTGDVEKIVRNSRGRFNARLQNLPELFAMVGIEVPPGSPIEEVGLYRLVLGGRASAEGITLESGSFSGGGGTVTLERLTAAWPRSGPLLEGLSLSAGLKADLPDLSRVAALFGVKNLRGELRAEVDIEGAWPNLGGAIELHGNNLRYGEDGVDSLVLVARSDPAGWRIVNLETGRGEDRLSGRGVVAMSPLRFKETVLDLTVKDIKTYLGWLPVGEIPRVSGGLTAHLEFSGSPAAPEGEFKTILTDAAFDGYQVSRVTLAGAMAGETVEVALLQAQTPEGMLELAGTIHHQAWGLPISGTVDRLVLSKKNPFLQLLAPVAFRVDGKKSWSFTETTLQGEGGTFDLKGEVLPRTGCNLALRLSEIRSEPWLELFPELPLGFNGLTLKAAITGELTAPEVTLSGSVADLRAFEAHEPLAGQIDIHVSSRGIVLKSFAWTTKSGERIVLNGTIPFDPYGRRFIAEPLTVKGLFSAPDLKAFSVFLPEKYRLTGSLNGTLNISGSGEHPEAAIDMHAREVRLPDLVKLSPPGPISADAELFLKDNDLRVESFTAHGNDFNMTISGYWRQAGSLLTRKPAEGLPGTLDLRSAVTINDLSWLARELPAVRRLGGRVAGSLALSGPASGPEISADFSLVDGEFRGDTALPPLQDLQAHLVVAQHRATVESLTGSVGGSPFTVSGSINLPDGEAPAADLRVRGSNLLLYRSEGLGVRGDTDITVRGPFTALAFAGTVVITDGKLRRNIDWLGPLRGLGRSKAPVAYTGEMGGIGFSFHNPPLKDATFDLHLTSRNPFEVKSNVARGKLRPDLQLQGSGEIPLLTGVIYIDPSRVMLPGGRLAIDSGLIRFSENSPGRPQLEISGSSRLLGYDINATVEGYYDKPTISLSSVPPLPQDALLLLLLTGKLPAGVAEQNGGWQGGMNVALYVGRGVLEEWFGGGLDSDESLLERLDVVVGQGISRQGNETIGAQFRLADDVVRDGDELYLVAERDIYEEFNAGLRIVFHFK